MSVKEIKAGIYRNYKGNLYFVLAPSTPGADPTDDDQTIIVYHPLYQVENLGWRWRTFNAFFREVDRPEFKYVGPRFVKIADWNLPNLIPGTKFRNAVNAEEIIMTVTAVVEIEPGKIAVHTDDGRKWPLAVIEDWASAKFWR